MKQRLRPKLTYANVIATIALFVALGGAATAATQLPKNSVGAKQIKRGAVNTSKLRKNAVRKNKIAPKSVTIGKLGPQAVGPGNIGNGAVKTNKLATQAVNASKIRNNTVTTNKLNNNSVTNQKLAPEAVGAGNLQNAAVGPANMRINSVGTATLQNGSVTAEKLAADVGPVLGTLKSGQTLRGVFSLGGDELEELRSSESFQFPLLAKPATPEANILEAAFPTAACPGLGGGLDQTPLAAPGNLCVYVTEKEGLAGADPEFDPDVTNRLGFGLIVALAAASKFHVSGQWAVTAP